MNAEQTPEPVIAPDMDQIAVGAECAYFRVPFANLSRPEWSAELYRTFGIQPGDRRPIGGDMFHAFHPDDRATIERGFAAILKGAKRRTERARIIRPDGSVRHVVARLWAGPGPQSAQSQSSQSQSGQSQGGQGQGERYIHGLVIDITNGGTEEALLASERAYRFVAENTRELILRLSADGQIQFASRACKRLLGYDPAEMIGRHANDFIPKDFTDRLREAFVGHMRDGKTQFEEPLEYQAIRKDGSHIWLESLPSLVYDGDGALLGWMDVIRDITGRKKLEEQAEQDRRARRLAEDASNAKTAFISSMSHELRTPLNAIIGYAELLQEEAGAGEQQVRADAQRIERAGRHLLELINQVLDLGKVEAGMLEAQLRPVRLDDLLEAVMETVEPLAGRNGNRLKLERRGALGVISTDERLLKQALLNLASNACKFTENGEIRITARLRGARLEVQVRDTGIGIAPEVAQRLFQPFVQADNSSSRQYGGTGLGLALTRRFAQLLGGDVTLQSRPGEGSVFTLTVAARAVAARPVAAQSPSLG